MDRLWMGARNERVPIIRTPGTGVVKFLSGGLF